MATGKESFFDGVRRVSPMLLGVIPFGVVCGAVCVDVGIPVMKTALMSIIIFAGASQLAAVQLMAQHAPMAVAIGTALVINMRYIMYSASIGPHLQGHSLFKKMILAYVLVDQSYATSINRFAADREPVHKAWFFFGASITMWLGFNTATLAGALLGAVIPPTWSLDFAIPLTFTALVIPAVVDRPTLLAAVSSGLVALLAAPLPYNLGLMAAAVTGILVGFWAEGRMLRG